MSKYENDFFCIECSESDYNILFHRPTGKISKVNKDFVLDDQVREGLTQKFPELQHTNDEDSKLEFGKGMIGLTYMSSRTCNLGCRYCFAEEGEYGKREDKPSFFTYENYMNSIKTALEMYPQGIKSICFFGGEPLLNFNIIKQFIPDCIDYLEKRGANIPKMSVASNIIALTEEMAEFFKKYDVSFVISLDGSKELNDFARITKSNKTSVYDMVVSKAKILEKYKIRYAVQATINKNHLSKYKKGFAIQWLQELEELNWENLAVVPVETDISDMSISGENELRVLEEFLKELVRYTVDKLKRGCKDHIVTGLVAPMLQVARNKYIRSCSAGHSVYFDTDGNIYPCQMFCNFDESRLGDIEHGWDKTKVEEYANIGKSKSEHCKACIAYKYCSMWCKGLQLISNGDMLKTCEPRCLYQKVIVEESIRCLIEINKDKEVRDLFWKTYKEVSEKLINNGYIKRG